MPVRATSEPSRAGAPAAVNDGAQRPIRPFPNVLRRNLMQEWLEVPILARLLRLRPHSRILEVGCGRGIALPVLDRLTHPKRLVGLDIDNSLLSEARGRVRRAGASAELYHGDVRDLPFPDRSFDFVLDFGTCYHIGDPGRALREIERVLAWGGAFVYETLLSQLLSHPVRSQRRGLPWAAVTALVPRHRCVLWSSRVKRRVRVRAGRAGTARGGGDRASRSVVPLGSEAAAQRERCVRGHSWS